jgi:hypothetical protein
MALDIASYVGTVHKRWGARGIQVLVLSYLSYRYLRAFVRIDASIASYDWWAVRLWGDGTQFSISKLGVPFIAVTVATPLVVLALDYLARIEEEKAGLGSPRLEGFFLSLAVLGLSTGFVWMTTVVWSPAIDGPAFAPSLPFAILYSAASLGVAVLAARAYRRPAPSPPAAAAASVAVGPK